MVAIDEVLVTLRTNDRRLHDVLEDVLEPRLQDPIGDHPVNFSVEVSTEPRRFHRLLWGRCVAVRTFDSARVLRALDNHLGLALDPAGHLVRVRLPAFVKDDRAVLLPAQLLRNTADIERRAATLGWLPTDFPFVDVDPESSEIVVSEPGELDVAAVLHRWNPGPARRRDGRVEPGRYRIDEVLLEADEDHAHVTPASTLAHLGEQFEPPLVADAATAVGDLLGRVEIRPVGGDARSVIRRLQRRP